MLLDPGDLELGLVDEAAACELRRVDELVGRASPPAPDNVFCREGDVWRIAFAGQEAVLRDAKGLRDIAALLAAPGSEIPATALFAAGGGRRVDADPRAVFGADPVLDPVARNQYRARLADLDADLAEAEDHHDLERAAAVRTERDFLVHELAAAIGLAGRTRGLGDDRERARKAVTARIRDSIARLGKRLPALGEHLQAAVSTGHLCAYRPDQPDQPDQTVRWRL